MRNYFKIGDKVIINEEHKNMFVSEWYIRWKNEPMTVKEIIDAGYWITVEENECVWSIELLNYYFKEEEFIEEDDFKI